ncbi:MAG: cytochrome-c oxidase, cbb3-type subunit III [Pseudomonadota bacterium]|nr:cytochrome-c oxidase, cbb3-type subunit III [Pseudomonadota bacterium]
MPTKIEKDQATGVDTTGHEWDGVRELNNPLPRWWLYVFYATVVFSIGYMVIFPSVPYGDGYLKGTADYSARVEVEESLAEAKAAQGDILAQVAESDLETIRGDQNLLAFSIAGGGAAFAENCAACHGTGATGGPGYPNLQDDDWLWGGDLNAIQTTIRHGIRWEQNEDTRYSEMPPFGDGILDSAQIAATTQYVLSLAGLDHDAATAAAGQTVYAEQCAACHKADGSGDPTLGAPALNDAVWLYAGNADEIATQIARPRHGVMPAWDNRLSPVTIKMLTVYVHELGGGQ